MQYMNWFWPITETHKQYVYDGLDRVETIPQETNTNDNSWFRLDFLLLNCVFRYSKARLAIVQFGKMIQEKWPAIRCVVMHTHTLAFLIGTTLRKICCPKSRYYNEPTTPNWINIVSIIKNPLSGNDTDNSDVFDTSSIFTMEEQYNESFNDRKETDIFDETDAFVEFQTACYSASRIFDNQSNVEEIVVWMKNTNRNEQIVRVWTSQCSVFPSFDSNPPNYSNVKLVYVEYQHPKMNGVTIEFVLPKSLLIVDNELFSAGFICRWLHYFAETDYVFDDNYILSIMDDNINQYTLLYGDYIVLEKDGLVQMSPPLISGESSVVDDDLEPEDVVFTE